MQKYKLIIVLEYLVAITGVVVMIFSYFLVSFALSILGIILVVVGIIAVLITMGMNLFFKDKELDIEKLRQMGLTIVVCKQCFKENVLEDQYCIYCGESLGSDEDEVQEEHRT